MENLKNIAMAITGLILAVIFLMGIISTTLLLCGMRFYIKDPNPPSKYELVQENLYRLK